MLLRPNEWKSLRSRYEEDRPHRMLALDGGGIRGLITFGILSQIEELIHQKTGQKLCEYFAYIAGTSTGAIIAAGLSLGKTTDPWHPSYCGLAKTSDDPPLSQFSRFSWFSVFAPSFRDGHARTAAVKIPATLEFSG
jgi:predicted acylesterase/phospholipase RssA